MSDMGSEEVLCVFNAAAGVPGVRGTDTNDRRRRLAALFARHGRKVTIVSPGRGDEIASIVRSAVERGDRRVLAAGGDGTMNAVASVLVGTETALGVLALGTLNHFAKDLQIPLELEDAVATAFNEEIAQVDVGEVNGRYFLNNSSIGLYPGIVREREVLQQRGESKLAAFAKALVFATWRFSLLSVRLLVDVQERITKTPFVFVGNNRYEVAGPNAGRRLSLDGGKLWICQAPQAGRLRLMLWALHALLGGKRALQSDVLEARNLVLETSRRSLHVATDGEITRMRGPLYYAIRPRALAVVVATGRGKARD